MDPLFSVITITRNAASTLPPTLRSVESQQFADFEWLLIDGVSTDNTVDLAEQARIANKRVYCQSDKGLYDAMNRGLHKARGRYVIFLNAGDAFPGPDTLEIYAKAIKDAPELPGMVYGQTTLVDADRRPIGPRHLTAPERLTASSFKQGMLVCHQAMAVRRDLAPDYDLQYRFSADYDWCIKVLKASPLNVYTGAVTAFYLNEGTTTANHKASLKERYDIMCRNYGTLPTMLRHAWFAIRQAKRKIKK